MSWDYKGFRDLLSVPGVERVRSDQCQCGQEVTFGTRKGGPINKPTGFMRNTPQLLTRLGVRCQGGLTSGACSMSKGGTHQQCNGRVAKEAAKYSNGLCRANIRGMIDAMHVRGIMKRGERGLRAVTDEDREEAWPEGCSGRYRDDIIGFSRGMA